MRKEYGKVLRDLFTESMKRRLSQFEPVKYPSNMYVIPGERIFRWIPKEPIHCFVILSPSPKDYDEFTVEIGWSTNSRFPELSMRPSGRPTNNRSEFSEAEYTCRLPDLLPGLDEWWGISSMSISGFKNVFNAINDSIKPISKEKAKEVVLPAVNESMDLLLSHGVPYLNEFYESR